MVLKIKKMNNNKLTLQNIGKNNLKEMLLVIQIPAHWTVKSVQ